jgi:exodeoxyribonuclease VII large subunit
MPKPLQSQWDFGKPEPAAAPERRVFSVTELTAKIRSTLETTVGFPWVSGEITNLRLQTSGHTYFTLKDQYAQISCVLFKADVRSFDRALLKEGQTVILQGEMTVYEPRGQYQLRVINLELQGAGKLQAAFERLKQKLHAEGLFAPARKRPIPKFPRRIGLVTSLDGAALHDVLHVVQRRNPALEIFLAPCRVQGPEASREIAFSLKLLNDFSDSMGRTDGPPGAPLDLILLTRGGGSLEDLWAFNEELAARAIVASKLPVISAVGHEIDFTISDFASDLRAATPSAAAEQITEAAIASRQAFAEFHSRLRRLIHQRIQWRREELDHARQTIERRQPMRVLRELHQRLDDLRDQLERRHPIRILRERQQTLSNLRDQLDRCARAQLRDARETFRNAAEHFRRLRISDRLRRERQHLDQLAQHLRLLSPQHTLDRGYSITTDAATGVILRDPAKTARGQRVRTRLAKGQIDSTVD